MKKTVIFSLLLLMVGITACSPKEKTQPITYQEFIDKIWDFETYHDTLVFKGNNTVIVDFYAKWCGPCRQLLPLMEKMANQYDGKLTVYKVNVDKEPKLASTFKVKGLPVFYLFSPNGYFKRYEGLASEADLTRIIEEQLIK